MKNFTEKPIKIPLDALLCLPASQSDQYVEQALNLPKNIYKLLTSSNTGSYIIGLTKQYDIPVEKTSVISFLLLEVSLGEKSLAQLPTSLSTELQLSNEQAQKMANEIEKDLFAPVMMDLNKHIKNQKRESQLKSPTEGMDNVVNLKENPKPKNSFPLPPRK